METKQYDPVKVPLHYNDHPSGIECREITEHLNSNLANTFKYVFRHQLKSKPAQDIEKAIQYLQYEKTRVQNDIANTRFSVQPEKGILIKTLIQRIASFEGLTQVKTFYKNFVCLLAANSNFNNHYNLCIDNLQAHLIYLKRNA